MDGTKPKCDTRWERVDPLGLPDCTAGFRIASMKIIFSFSSITEVRAMGVGHGDIFLQCAQ